MHLPQLFLNQRLRFLKPLRASAAVVPLADGIFAVKSLTSAIINGALAIQNKKPAPLRA